MKTTKNKIAKTCEKLVLAVAKMSWGSASMWGYHQPKVPDAMKKEKAKK